MFPEWEEATGRKGDFRESAGLAGCTPRTTVGLRPAFEAPRPSGLPALWLNSCVYGQRKLCSEGGGPLISPGPGASWQEPACGARWPLDRDYIPDTYRRPDALGSRGFKNGCVEAKRAFFQDDQQQILKMQLGPSGKSAASAPGQALPLPQL